MPDLKSATVRIAASLAGGAILLGTVATGTASALPTAPTIREGARGTAVSCVQLAVDLADNAGLTVDSIFGPKTLAAVEDFQRRNHLSADGIVGKDTGTAMWLVDAVHSPDCYTYLPTHT